MKAIPKLREFSMDMPAVYSCGHCKSKFEGHKFFCAYCGCSIDWLGYAENSQTVDPNDDADYRELP